MNETTDETEATDEIEELAKKVRAELDAADERIIEGDAGTLIVKLRVPIKVGGEDFYRLTFGRIRVRHVRATRPAPDPLEAYADLLIEPAGAFDELLSDDDYTACLRAAERQLKKFRGGGRSS